MVGIVAEHISPEGFRCSHVRVPVVEEFEFTSSVAVSDAHTFGCLTVDEGAQAHQYRLRLPFREERRDEGRPRPAYAPRPTPPYDIIPDSCPDYYYFYIRPDLSKATHCWRPPAAVFIYLSAVGVPIEREYGALWERLVDQEMRLHEIVPDEQEPPVAVLRLLLGAPDTSAFPLPSPLSLRTELGQRPAVTELSLDAATVRVEAD